MVLNVCFKFHENMSSGFKVMERTRKMLTHKGQLLNKRAMMALGRSPEYQWDQIISKSVHRFSRRSFKAFFNL